MAEGEAPAEVPAEAPAEAPAEDGLWDGEQGVMELVRQEPGAVTAFDGYRMYLRSFPVWFRWRQVPEGFSAGKPESGEVDGVAFEQTMGRISLSYDMTGFGVESEDDILVEMSCWELRVTVGRDAKGGRKVAALTGELYADIRRRMSWWRLEDWGNSKRIVLYLTKMEHRAWGGPWYKDPLNIHRKQSFGWGPKHVSQQLLKALKSDEETLLRVEPGQPKDWDRSLCVGIAPSRLCTGVDDDEEDEKYITIHVHLDEEKLESALTRVPLEELFSANVDANYAEVMMRGDGFGICWGQLHGRCVPELTTWRVQSVRRRNLPQDSGIKCPAFYNPAICIRLVKEQGYQHLWGHAFDGVQGIEFERPRERICWTERVQRALVLSPASPMNSQIKAERAQKLCTRIECREDLLLNKVCIILHLEDRLTSLAEKFNLDLGTFFTIKVTERVLEVGVVADAEFTMCIGGLGGSCLPDRTTWELVSEKNSPTEAEEHPALKVGLSKAPYSRERWVDVFTRWEPWQVVEQQIQDQQRALRSLPSKAAAEEEEDEEDKDPVSVILAQVLGKVPVAAAA